MAKVKLKKQPVYTLTLTQKEAKWLRDITQNHLVNRRKIVNQQK